MSDDEEKMLIGSMALEYAAAKKRLAAIGHKAEQLYLVLVRVANTVKHGTQYDELQQDLAKLPTREEVERLIAERTEADGKLHELEKMLRDVGLSPTQ